MTISRGKLIRVMKSLIYTVHVELYRDNFDLLGVQHSQLVTGNRKAGHDESDHCVCHSQHVVVHGDDRHRRLDVDHTAEVSATSLFELQMVSRTEPKRSDLFKWGLLK